MIVAAAFFGVAVTYYADHRTTDPNAADIGFVNDMTLHHSQARTMSFLYNRNGTATTLQSTAVEIVQAQSGDIRLMQLMSNDWPTPSGDSDTVMAWMDMKRPVQQMPGFANDASLRQLDTLRGRPLDDLFTTLMIHHHFGGIDMANEYRKRGDIDQLKDLAGAMIKQQTKEVAELNQWRASAGLSTLTTL